MIPASLYHIIFLYTIVVLTLFQANSINTKGYSYLQKIAPNFFWALIVAGVFSLFLGMRPIDGVWFGDTANYATRYHLLQLGVENVDRHGEKIWTGFMALCASAISYHDFLTICAIGYFGFTLWACKRMIPNNVLAGFLFCLGAFSFYTYCVNGVRNGLACSLVLLAISFVSSKKSESLIALLISVIAIGIHKTVALPLIMLLLSLKYIKSFKITYVFWILSILISLVTGNTLSAWIGSLGFDDRLDYLTTEANQDVFSKTGFRWDFLIYSLMPILLGYYIIYKKNIRNRFYEVILNTYTLSNAFWVIVIRASYSNRFAYLSWFMYGLVLAYPLFKLNIWGNRQGHYIAMIMLAQIAFTWFMNTIY